MPANVPECGQSYNVRGHEIGAHRRTKLQGAACELLIRVTPCYLSLYKLNAANILFNGLGEFSKCRYMSTDSTDRVLTQFIRTVKPLHTFVWMA